MDAATIIKLAVIVFVTISGWIVTIRVRHRMRRALGRRASDLDLVSFKAWNEVEEAEQQKAIHPE
jgi:hypothetical protein